MWSNKLITINYSRYLDAYTCCRLLMTRASLSCRTQPSNMTLLFSIKTTLLKSVFNLMSIAKVAFDWIYVICLRILHLLSRLMFAIPAHAIVKIFPFVSNGLLGRA